MNFKNEDYAVIISALEKRLKEREEIVESLKNSWPYPSIQEELKSEEAKVNSDLKLRKRLNDILSTFKK
jgi:hypothetical protein